MKRLLILCTLEVLYVYLEEDMSSVAGLQRMVLSIADSAIEFKATVPKSAHCAHSLKYSTSN
jgi:hypothetical protein